ncbi:MAG TPA: hypothetical protein VF941_08275 [Clostridia bacterium]
MISKKILFSIVGVVSIYMIISTYAGIIYNKNVTASNETAAATASYDVDVSIKYKIELEDKVKKTNPNIIKAAREAIFLTDCEFSKLQHYNGYKRQGFIDIFEVIEQGKNSWEVRYRLKEKESDKYDDQGYCSVNVEKQETGSYKGFIVHSWPAVKDDETF